MQVTVTLNQPQGFDERHRAVKTPPLARMAMPGHIKTVAADILQTRKRRIELGLERVRIVRAEALQEAIFVAMPFARDGDRIVERGAGPDLGQEARAQPLGQK